MRDDTESQHGPTSSANDRIIEATLRLIAEHGLGAVTMRQIAETAGVARQTLYNHHPDVDSIVVEAISHHNQLSIRMLDDALRVIDRPEDKLEQLVRHAVVVGAHAQHTTGLEHGLAPSARATLRDYDTALDDRIRTILEDGRESGTFRTDLSPTTDAVLIRHLLTGLAEQAATSPDVATLTETGTRTVLASVMHLPD